MATTKLHCEFAGGIENSWGYSKKVFRSLPLHQKKTRALFRKAVKENINTVKINNVRAFSARAHCYMLAFFNLMKREHGEEETGGENTEGVTYRDIEHLVNKVFKTHRNAADFDNAFISRQWAQSQGIDWAPQQDERAQQEWRANNKHRMRNDHLRRSSTGQKIWWFFFSVEVSDVNVRVPIPWELATGILRRKYYEVLELQSSTCRRIPNNAARGTISWKNLLQSTLPSIIYVKTFTAVTSLLLRVFVQLTLSFNWMMISSVPSTWFLWHLGIKIILLLLTFYSILFLFPWQFKFEWAQYTWLQSHQKP